MEPIPLCGGYLILPETETISAYTACGDDCAAALSASAQDCAAVAEAVRERVPVGMVLACLHGPDEDISTEALIAQYKAILKQGIPDQADLLYLRGTDCFASLRCAVIAATDVSGRTIMAEVPVGQDGILPYGTDIVAAVGVLQRIGVSTVILSGETAQDVADALEKCAPYARISLGARVEAAWIEQGLPFPSAELFLPRRAEETEAVRRALRSYVPAPPVPRDHDDFLLAPDGTNAHFLDPLVDISDEIEVGSRLSERLIEAEDDAGALKLQFETEDDLVVFESHVFMLARPVCLCAEQPELLEAALRIYPGRALYDGTWPLDEPLLKYFSEKYGMIVL